MANTNGRIHDARQPSIAPLDRGFLYGDAVYEVWRSYGRTVFAWREHWDRLRRSAAALYLELPVEEAQSWEEVRRTVEAFQEQAGAYDGEFYIRLQISRGGGAIGLDSSLADAAGFVVLVQANSGLPREKLEEGYRLSLETTLRRNATVSLNPAWKTGNYLNNVLCLRAARARGADDVLMLNLVGELTEASSANIAFVRSGCVCLPPLGAGILAGITRDLILTKIAPDLGVEVEERVLRPEDIPEMDECFLMSTTRDVTPVGAIDETRFAVGPGTITRRLKAAFEAYAADYAREHREYALDQ